MAECGKWQGEGAAMRGGTTLGGRTGRKDCIAMKGGGAEGGAGDWAGCVKAGAASSCNRETP